MWCPYAYPTPATPSLGLQTVRRASALQEELGTPGVRSRQIRRATRGAMDAFRVLLEEKKKAAAADFGGRRYVKQSEVEGVRLKRLRDEEQSELEHKVSRQAVLSGKAGVLRGPSPLLRYCSDAGALL